MRLVPDRRLRRSDNGAFLIGGAPTTLLRLSADGAASVAAWFRGESIPDDPASHALAARLVANGMAHPDPEVGDPLSLAVVIPVRNDPEGLAATLEALGDQETVIVHDDDPQPMGPAGARNEGLARLAARDRPRPAVIAFVDAGVTVSPEQLHQLARHLADADVVAVAPRVRPTPSAGSVTSRYEQTRSPLDLGPDPASVGPGRAVSYVPSACLVVRADVALADGELFDPTMRYGEDVDLVWRLHAEERTIRYSPDVVVHHPPRQTVQALLRQRYGYGTAAGPLAAGHGADVTPLRVSRWSLFVVGCAALGRPMLALGGWLITAEMLARRLPADLPQRRLEALRLTGSGHLGAIRQSGEALVRPWWPLALIFPRSTARLVMVGWLRRRPTSLIELLLGPLDDGAYGLGVLVSSAKKLRTRWPAVTPVIK